MFADELTRGPEGMAHSLCCGNGKMRDVPVPQKLPDTLQTLLTAKTKEATKFQDNVRSYNSALGFVSFQDSSTKADAGSVPGRGPPVYVVHGQCYHATGTLQPAEGKQPSYGQLYIFDPKEANDQRMSAYANLDRPILDKLANLLHDLNPYAALL